MTRAKALAEAQRRWGPEAYAEYRMDSRNYWVGAGGGIFHVCAYGDSWEDAFRQADAKANEVG